MTHRHPLWAALACAVLSAHLGADTSVGSAYLLGSVSPQEAALGGGALAAYGSADAQWENPAALAGTGAMTFGFSQGFNPQGGIGEYAAGALGLGAGLDQHLGIQAYYLGQSDTYRNDEGQVSDSFTDSDSLLGLGYEHALGPVALGVGLKVLGESLANFSAQPGILADLGLVYQVNPDWLLSAAVRNFGSIPEWSGASSYRPESLEFAARENLLKDTPASPHLYEILGWDDPNSRSVVDGLSLDPTTSPEYFYGLGVDYVVQGPFPLDLRAGYASNASDPAFPYGLSAGFGLTWSDLELDYSFSYLGELGASNLIAVTWTPALSKFQSPNPETAGAQNAGGPTRQAEQPDTTMPAAPSNENGAGRTNPADQPDTTMPSAPSDENAAPTPTPVPWF